MTSLLCIEGALFGARFPIHRELTLGRGAAAAVMLPDLQVSRIHASIRHTSEGYELIDADSRNGTFVNGERLQAPRHLVPGDTLQVGSSRFLFAASEECLRTRYGSTWVILGGGPVDPGSDGPEPGGLDPDSGASILVEDLQGLRDLLTATLDEEGLVRSLLTWLIERVGAARGALFSIRPGEAPHPLVVLPASPSHSIQASLLARALEGASIHHRGPVELARFAHGQRVLETRSIALIAVPWRLSGEVGGLVWLERDPDRDGFGAGGLARIDRMMQLAGPALDNARRIRADRRRQRADTRRDDGERIPAQVYLELAGLLDPLRTLARGDDSLVIVGPRGIGKDRIARLAHASSARAEGPLVRINCASLSEAQAMLELLGAERGSLPGLELPHAGRLELADGGTLMLEQVDALEPPVQEALLRALSLRQVTRRSGDQPIPIDVRVISTSARSLERLVRDGQLRPELLPWIGARKLEVPGLDEMRRHVLTLARVVISRMNLRLARSVRGLAGDAEQALAAREWTLNLWELEDLLIRAMAVAEGEALTAGDLELAETIPARAAPESGAGALRLSDTLRDAERRLVVQALRLSRGHRGQAAELLGVSRESLEQKILAYAIDLERLRGDLVK